MNPNTDPGDLFYLFDNVPDDLESICSLIKHQLIHPDMVNKFRHILTTHTKREDSSFSTVRDMLEALLERNANGIIFDREPCERLILSCRYHSLLLMSILRSKGIPVRCRVGFAKYLSGLKSKYVDIWTLKYKKKTIDIFPRKDTIKNCPQTSILSTFVKS